MKDNLFFCCDNAACKEWDSDGWGGHCMIALGQDRPCFKTVQHGYESEVIPVTVKLSKDQLDKIDDIMHAKGVRSRSKVIKVCLEWIYAMWMHGDFDFNDDLDWR